MGGFSVANSFKWIILNSSLRVRQIAMSTLDLKIEAFRETYLSEYTSWFQDDETRRWLGAAPDGEWLAYVLTDPLGSEFAATQRDDLVAVIGVVFPTQVDDYFAITNIAVNPRLRRKGMGRRILRAIVKQVATDSATSSKPLKWKAFVESDNRPARQLFASSGWKLESVQPDEQNLLTYQLDQCES